MLIARFHELMMSSRLREQISVFMIEFCFEGQRSDNMIGCLLLIRPNWITGS